MEGYRPLIQTIAGESVVPDGDIILIKQNPDGNKSLMRTQSASAITEREAWNNPTLAQQQGPLLPLGADVVQASGRHSDPVFYVSDQLPNPTGPVTPSLWRWKAGDQDWTRIVPGIGANEAHSYFVNPYNPNIVYIIDRDGIKRSDHAGDSWIQDWNLQNAVTQNGEFSLLTAFDEGLVLSDMVFSSSNPRTIFAIGNAGVFYSINGVSWTRLLSSVAIPSHPMAGFFDEDTRSLYIGINGRGIIRYDGIPS